ncbi:hypothetical protein B0T11DRAFT_290052 [Plectosphaerella cucumerina]|uniref:F-box domain-containing protein n=1 Tax=Plectosphaerella cucumerina TaxID=40658 RepID=A0A8K0T7K7_9PEZI|nr:hypothetical protein B0T11DRAFT_290052 [Plectosphaerella cucumerina]
MTSAQHVLQVPELFELILAEVPMRTLLTSAQLVSRSWKKQITSSRRIQQALFLEPCPPDTPPRINPLLAAEFPIFFDGKQHRRDDFSELAFGNQAESSRKGLSSPPAPLFHSSGNSIAGSVAQGAANAPSVEAAVIYDHDTRLALREKFLRPSASWRRMLPCQPAVMEVGLWRYERVQGNRSVGYFSVLLLATDEHDSSTDASNLNKKQTGNARADARVVNEDHNRLGWTMGAIYDEGIETVSFGSLSFRVFWDIQSIMRREAEEDLRRSDSFGSGYDSDGNRAGGGRGKDPGSGVRIAQAKVYKGVTSPDDDVDDDESWQTRRFEEALGDRNVVFQTIHQRGCGMGVRMSEADRTKVEKAQRDFETYFRFQRASWTVWSRSWVGDD